MVEQLYLKRQLKKLEGGAQLKQVENEVSENSKANTVAFYAGRLKDFFSEWQNITEDKYILDIVENCHIEFDEKMGFPCQSGVPHSVFAKSDVEKIDKQISEFCDLGLLRNVNLFKISIYLHSLLYPKKMEILE